MKESKLPTARDLIAKIIPNQANFEHCGKHRTINGSLLLDIERAIKSHTQAHTDGLRAALSGIVEAWEALPEGHYTPKEIQKWIVKEMHPSIVKAREVLK